jgi:hypothetical protein
VFAGDRAAPRQNLRKEFIQSPCGMILRLLPVR